MKLHELQPVEGSRKERNRVGRGIGSGNGKTSGRGQKGQKARSGGGVRPGFEGGQNPLFRRIPKRGFNNVNRKEYAVVNLTDLNKFEDGTVVSPALLVETKVIKKELSGVKVLANGKLEKKLTVQAHKFSSSAKEAIEVLKDKAKKIESNEEISQVASISAGDEEIGKLIAKRAKIVKIEEVVFDRSGHLYHGVVKQIADSAREEGLKF